MALSALLEFPLEQNARSLRKEERFVKYRSIMGACRPIDLQGLALQVPHPKDDGELMSIDESPKENRNGS